MIAEQFPGILLLPDDAKLQLAGELFADVAGHDGSENAALTELIDARLAEYRDHPERVSTWDDVKARLLKRAS